VGAVLALAGLSVAAASPAIEWGERPRAALDAAESSGRPVLVDVWAIWCAPCKVMDETTWVDRQVVAATDDFVPLRVDADAQQAFIERYAVKAFPTVLFLDADGDEIGRLTGLVTAEALLPRLRQVRVGYVDYMSHKDQRGVAAAQMLVAAYLVEAGNAAGAMQRLRRAQKLLGSEDRAARDVVELRLAEAQAIEGNLAAAAKRYERLSRTAVEPTTRAEALSGLVAVELRRDREGAAAAAAERLRTEFPDLASHYLAGISAD
jgi:thioredoxin-like negative regulator of GroEL